MTPPPQQNLSEQVMETFNKKFDGTIVSDGINEPYIQNVGEEEMFSLGSYLYGIESYLRSTLQDIEKQVLGVVGADIEIGESTHCKSCGQHVAAGECNCTGINQERSRLRSELSKLFRGER